MKESSKDLIKRLQTAACESLDPLIPIGSSVVLLDFPNHSNVGDSLIWLGEIAYLRRRQAKIRYVCESWSLVVEHLRSRLTPETMILIHGGGNFGTLWPDHHAFRLNVIREFPEHQIIQLPQSVYFSEEPEAAEAITKTKQAISEHPRFSLLVRDQTSADITQELLGLPSQVLPDMAFFLGSIAPRSSPQNDFFLLSRSDHEKSEHWDSAQLSKQLLGRLEERDWLKSGLVEMVIRHCSRLLGKRGSAAGASGVTLTLGVWNAMAKAELRRGAGILCRGQVLVTDRLHAHILAVLLDKPHVVVDNSNAKITGYMQTWSGSYEKLRLAKDLEQALKAADRMLQC